MKVTIRVEHENTIVDREFRGLALAGLIDAVRRYDSAPNFERWARETGHRLTESTAFEYHRLSLVAEALMEGLGVQAYNNLLWQSGKAG